MKIICAGLWKTGTKSLAEALTILGYKVYDYDYQLLEFPDLWNKCFDGTVTDDEIRETLKSIDATIEGPTITFWEQISRSFPDAKVILTIRNEDNWYRSLVGEMDKAPALFKYFIVFMYLIPTGRKFIATGFRVWSYCLGVGIPMFMNTNPRMLKYKYRQHNCYVQHAVPKEKLLVFNAEDGWKPLCEFLSEEIPGVPYPHKNSPDTTKSGTQHPAIKRMNIEFLIALSVFVTFIAWVIYMMFGYLY